MGKQRNKIQDQQNLLRVIKNDPDHPWNKLIDVCEPEDGDEYTKINTFDKSRGPVSIYSQKQRYLEELAREIIMQTLLRDSVCMYNAECVPSINIAGTTLQSTEQNRCDLISQPIQGGRAFNLIEIKQRSSDSIKQSDFETLLESGFTQLYTKYIMANKSLEHSNLFTSVVIMDVDKLVRSPHLLEGFITLAEDQKTTARVETYRQYGIFIQTRKYEDNGKTPVTVIGHELPNHFILQQSAEVDFFGQKSIIAKIYDAIHFTTVGGEYEVKNVRDVKPLSDSEKAKLTDDILQTLVTAYVNNDYNGFDANSNTRVLIYVPSKTIMTTAEELKSQKKFIMCSMSGAIIDGQNSLDSVKRIMTIALAPTKESFKSNSPELKIFNRLAVFLRGENRAADDHQRRRFVEFVMDSNIQIRVQSAEDVRDANKVASAKNNTMPVTKIELHLVEHIRKVQLMSHIVSQETDSTVILNYPKKRNYGYTETDIAAKGIVFETFCLYDRWATYITDSKASNWMQRMFHSAKELSRNQPTTDAIDKTIKSYVKDGGNYEKEIKICNDKLDAAINDAIEYDRQIAESIDGNPWATKHLAAAKATEVECVDEIERLRTNIVKPCDRTRLGNSIITIHNFRTAKINSDVKSLPKFDKDAQRELAFVYTMRQAMIVGVEIPSVEMFTHYILEISLAAERHVKKYPDVDFGSLKKPSIEYFVANTLRSEFFKGINLYAEPIEVDGEVDGEVVYVGVGIAAPDYSEFDQISFPVIE